MSYGLSIKNDAGNFLIQDSMPSYSFVGKAIYDSFTDHSSVSSSWTGRGYYWSRGFQSRNCSGGISGTGRFEVRIFGSSANSPCSYSSCTYDVTSIQLVAGAGIGRFHIYSFRRPITFSYHSNCASITDSGIVDGEGKTRWNISMLIGDISPASSREIYCFAPNPRVPTGYGLAVFDSNGATTFDSNYPILNIKDMMQITGLSANGHSSLSGIDYTYTGGTSIGAMSKPMFASVDWARWYFTRDSLGVRVRAYYNNPSPNGNSGCDDDRIIVYQWLTFIGVSSGFHWDGSTVVAAFNLSHLTGSGVGSGWGTEGDYTHSQKTIPMPIDVPIIDGADYD